MRVQLVKAYHPVVVISYYLILLVLIMSTTNPWLLTFYFIGSQSLQIIKKRHYVSLCYSLVVIVILTITNPLVVHRGGTILFFLFHKPVTKEALSYGFFMGILFATIFLTFQNMQETIDSGALTYLFGKRFPNAIMIVTLVFRFIPLYRTYYKELHQVQQTVQKMPSKRFKDKVSYGLDLFGQLFSWSLENAIDTADAMKARGYGLQKRSTRLTYKWHFRDTRALFYMILFVFGMFYSSLHHSFDYLYYPYLSSFYDTFQQAVPLYLVVLFYASYPTILVIKERLSWNILQSKI